MSEATGAGRLPPAGWHGKLPTVGDFASRRLPPEFVTPWDQWLAEGLHDLREQDPEGWLDRYLAAPSQRFLLMPGVLPGEAGAQAWAGVLMPSVDRVGRYFPLTIVQALSALPEDASHVRSLWGWLGRLDELAADALHDDWHIDRLEAELARMAGPDLPAEATGLPQPRVPEGAGQLIEQALAPALNMGQWIERSAQALWLQQARGCAFWHVSADQHPPGLRVSRGLPGSAAGLLGLTI